MSFRPALFVSVSAALVACAHISQVMPRGSRDLPPPNTTPYSFDAVARGKIVFDNACVRCHGLDEPGESALAMREVARRFRTEFTDEAAAVEHVVAWIGAPSRSQSMLPESVLEHWGVMDRVALDRDLALDVGHYVWSLGEALADTSFNLLPGLPSRPPGQK